jgi:ribosomal protein S14
MKMKIELESQEERELFERMKAKCSICGSTDCTHQVQFMSISMDEYIKLSDDLALARVLVRELGDRLAKLEKPWVGLTIEDVKVIEDNAPSKQMAIFMAEATLKEKNNG